MNDTMKNQLLAEITLEQYACFSKCYEDNDSIYIKKGNQIYSSIQAIREIIDIQNLLEKYKHYFSIDISLEGVVIRE